MEEDGAFLLVRSATDLLSLSHIYISYFFPFVHSATTIFLACPIFLLLFCKLILRFILRFRLYHIHFAYYFQVPERSPAAHNLAKQWIATDKTNKFREHFQMKW